MEEDETGQGRLEPGRGQRDKGSSLGEEEEEAEARQRGEGNRVETVKNGA